MFILDFIRGRHGQNGVALQRNKPSAVILSQTGLLTVDGTGVSDSTHAALEVSNLLVVITIQFEEKGGGKSNRREKKKR